jgi:hypothetical protein
MSLLLLTVQAEEAPPVSACLVACQINWRNQAMSQVCAFASPFSASMSAIAILRQLLRPRLTLLPTWYDLRASRCS